MHTAQNAENSDSTQTSSQTNQTDLSITTPRREAGLSIGTRLSSRGLETLRGLVRANRDNPTAHQIDQTIQASLRQDFASQLDFKTKTDRDFEVTGYAIQVRGEVPVAWRDAIGFFTKPAAPAFAAMEVTRLRTLTTKRKEGEFDLELSITAISEELSVYPEDIVQTVCRDWARKNRFFPVLAELIAECEKFMVLRRAIAKAFEEPVLQIEKRDDEWIPPTDDEKAEVDAMMADVIGARPEICVVL